jgi:hypothetical protein
MQAQAVAVRRASETLDEAVGVAMVVSIRQQDRRRREGAVGEPVESLRLWHQRVDRHPGVLEPVGGDLDVKLGWRTVQWNTRDRSSCIATALPTAGQSTGTGQVVLMMRTEQGA